MLDVLCHGLQQNIEWKCLKIMNYLNPVGILREKAKKYQGKCWIHNKNTFPVQITYNRNHTYFIQKFWCVSWANLELYISGILFNNYLQKIKNKAIKYFFAMRFTLFKLFSNKSTCNAFTVFDELSPCDFTVSKVLILSFLQLFDRYIN